MSNADASILCKKSGGTSFFVKKQHFDSNWHSQPASFSDCVMKSPTCFLKTSSQLCFFLHTCSFANMWLATYRTSAGSIKEAFCLNFSIFYQDVHSQNITILDNVEMLISLQTLNNGNSNYKKVCLISWLTSDKRQ